MFDIDRFVEDCRAAVAEDPTHKAAREVVARAMADPEAVIAALGEPRQSAVHKLYADDSITIANVVWAPWMTVMPHNHEMWAVIGVYSGREDNIFWRRIADAEDGRIEAAGARALARGDAVPLGPDIIHSVTNPLPRFTGAIHVYGGNFYSIPRSQWDAETLREAPYSLEDNLGRFEAFGRLTANAAE
jgi:predicted metal-dependent enzyme (double-stranded beta helix superfamily)